MIKSNQLKDNHVRTDDLAFSAYLKMKGHRILRSDRMKSKNLFVFEIGTEDENQLKVEFINSDFLNFYNELRNLKKLILR